MAGAAVGKPDGTIREVLFPVVGEQTLHDLVRESKATGRTYRTTLRATIRSSYRGHYRRAVLDLLAALDFRSNNDAHRPRSRCGQRGGSRGTPEGRSWRNSRKGMVMRAPLLPAHGSLAQNGGPIKPSCRGLTSR